MEDFRMTLTLSCGTLPSVTELVDVFRQATQSLNSIHAAASTSGSTNTVETTTNPVPVGPVCKFEWETVTSEQPRYFSMTLSEIDETDANDVMPSAARVHVHAPDSTYWIYDGREILRWVSEGKKTIPGAFGTAGITREDILKLASHMEAYIIQLRCDTIESAVDRISVAGSLVRLGLIQQAKVYEFALPSVDTDPWLAHAQYANEALCNAVRVADGSQAISYLATASVKEVKRLIPEAIDMSLADAALQMYLIVSKTAPDLKSIGVTHKQACELADFALDDKGVGEAAANKLAVRWLEVAHDLVETQRVVMDQLVSSRSEQLIKFYATSKLMPKSPTLRQHLVWISRRRSVNCFQHLLELFSSCFYKGVLDKMASSVLGSFEFNAVGVFKLLIDAGAKAKMEYMDTAVRLGMVRVVKVLRAAGLFPTETHIRNVLRVNTDMGTQMLQKLIAPPWAPVLVNPDTQSHTELAAQIMQSSKIIYFHTFLLGSVEPLCLLDKPFEGCFVPRPEFSSEFTSALIRVAKRCPLIFHRAIKSSWSWLVTDRETQEGDGKDIVSVLTDCEEITGPSRQIVNALDIFCEASDVTKRRFLIRSADTNDDQNERSRKRARTRSPSPDEKLNAPEI